MVESNFNNYYLSSFAEVVDILPIILNGDVNIAIMDKEVDKLNVLSPEMPVLYKTRDPINDMSR